VGERRGEMKVLMQILISIVILLLIGLIVSGKSHLSEWSGTLRLTIGGIILFWSLALFINHEANETDK
jgi:membrane protein CcdC involved in cytochrome C biogenesis